MIARHAHFVRAKAGHHATVLAHHATVTDRSVQATTATAAHRATVTVDLQAPKTAVVAEVLAKKATAQFGNSLFHAQSAKMLKKAR